MKQNFTHYFKSIILAIAFLLSGAVPTFGQQLYIYDGSGQMLWMANYSGQTVQITGSDSFCFAVVTFTGGDRILHYIAKSSSDAVNITTTAYTNNSLTTIYIEDPNSIDQNLLNNIQMFHIPNNEGSVNLCWKYENSTLSIAIHEISEVAETQYATCTEDGYVTYKCRQCGETRTEILNALGHSFGEWQTMKNGRFRTCSHDEENHIQYDMEATGVNALEITLTDGTKLSYPQTLNPVVSFSNLDLNISFDTDKTSTVSKADVKEYKQVWSHNKNGYAQNEDKTYSHACDYTDCGYKHDDLFVKNGEQYYAAEKKNGVIRVTDMTLNDSEGYDCEADITVGNVSYSRDMKDNQWGTLCLPFAITPSAYTEYCSFYQLNSVDNEKQEIVLSKIDGQNSGIAAGTPVLVRRNAAASGISISVSSDEEGEGVAMSNAVLTGSTAGNYSLVGTLTTSDALTDNCYIINNDKFWKVGNLIDNSTVTAVKVGAFRSYLVTNTPSAQAMMLSLSIGGDDTTAIDVLNAADDGEAEIYDLNGHRLPDLQKGVNIVKRGNKTTKVIIK